MPKRFAALPTDLPRPAPMNSNPGRGAAAETWWSDEGWAAAERDATDNYADMSRWDD